MKQERLFLAIGGAEPALLERSRRRRPVSWVRWGISAAACLAILCAATLLRPEQSGPSGGPPEPPAVSQPSTPAAQPPDTIFSGSASGELHLLNCGEDLEPERKFVLYINEDDYRGGWEGDAYVIRPVNPPPESLPECSLTVTHREGVSLEAALADARRTLAETFSMVLEPETAADRITISAYDGTEWGAEWDAANLRVTLVDDGRGGVYALTARFFTEAAEGHGVWFADMVQAFAPVSANTAVPNWMVSLQNAADILTAAALSDNWTAEANDLLTEGAAASAYGENVLELVAVARADFTVDDAKNPSSATVSVQHRLGTEDSYTYLTMELVRQSGQWLARFIGLEK